MDTDGVAPLIALEQIQIVSAPLLAAPVGVPMRSKTQPRLPTCLFQNAQLVGCALLLVDKDTLPFVQPVRGVGAQNPNATVTRTTMKKGQLFLTLTQIPMNHMNKMLMNQLRRNPQN